MIRLSIALILLLSLLSGCLARNNDMYASMGVNIAVNIYEAHQESVRLRDKDNWTIEDLGIDHLSVKYFSDQDGTSQIHEYTPANRNMPLKDFIHNTHAHMRSTDNYRLGQPVFFGFYVEDYNIRHAEQAIQILNEFNARAILNK